MTSSTVAGGGRRLDDLAGTAGRISAAVQSVIEGKPGVVRLVLTVLLVEGQVLL